MKPDGGRKMLLADIGRVLLVAGFFAAMLLLLRSDAVRHNLTEIAALRASLQAEEARFGAIASRLTFVVAASALVGAGVPRIYASAVAGAVYGAAEGIALALAASLLGSLLAYQFGRSMLANTVRRRVGGRFATYQEQCRRNPFWWVLYGRLTPFANSTLMNLLCGACRVPPRPFLLASAVGFLPLTIVFAMFGSGGAKGSWFQIGVGTASLAVSIAMQKVLAARRQAGAAGTA